MKIYFALTIAILLIGCGKPKSPATAANTNFSSGNPLTAPVDYLGAVGQAKKFSERTIDLVTVNRAIQSFYGIEDRYPKDLQELVSKHYLQSPPAAPAGFRLVYDPVRGEARMIRQ
jgi:hypothetical protein